MPKSRPPYPVEFRRQMVELVRAGRTPEELSKEFEPSAQTIRNWVCQMDIDEGRRDDGLTSEERAELRRLRRENKQLRVEREILANDSRGAPLPAREETPACRTILSLRGERPSAFWWSTPLANMAQGLLRT